MIASFHLRAVGVALLVTSQTRSQRVGPRSSPPAVESLFSHRLRSVKSASVIDKAEAQSH